MKVNIIRKNVKNLTLKIKGTREIEVVAPRSVSDDYIKKFVLSKEKWIKRKLQEAQVKSKKTGVRKLATGETLPYLGKRYPLVVSEGTKNYVDFRDNKFYLTVVDKSSFELKAEVLNSWYREQGRIVFLPIIAKYLKMTGKMVERVTVKTMKTKWGSCNFQKKYLNLNSEMLKKDIRFIEYVILHEIAHLEHPNHSKHFYKYIERFMPDYSDRISR